MSQDFPNREDWLAVRATPRNLRRGKYIHISKPLVHVPDGKGGIQTLLGPGTPYVVGNNQRKREKKAKWRRKA